jgi:hypothetical protein
MYMPIPQSLEDSAEKVLDVLRHRRPAAAFVTEIQASVGSPDIVDASLRSLSEAELVLLMTESAPDPHLEHFDLRVAAMIADGDRDAALGAAREVWGDWVRQFLAHHRCQ